MSSRKSLFVFVCVRLSAFPCMELLCSSGTPVSFISHSWDLWVSHAPLTSCGLPGCHTSRDSSPTVIPPFLSRFKTCQKGIGSWCVNIWLWIILTGSWPPRPVSCCYRKQLQESPKTGSAYADFQQTGSNHFWLIHTHVLCIVSSSLTGHHPSHRADRGSLPNSASLRLRLLCDFIIFAIGTLRFKKTISGHFCYCILQLSLLFNSSVFINLINHHIISAGEEAHVSFSCSHNSVQGTVLLVGPVCLHVCVCVISVGERRRCVGHMRTLWPCSRAALSQDPQLAA